MLSRRLLVIGVLAATRVFGQPEAASEIRPAIDRSLSLLTRSGEQWFTKQQCISCHHHVLPLLAFRDAQERGIPLDLVRIRSISDKALKLLRSPGGLDRAIQGSHMLDPGLSESYLLLGASAARLPRSVQVGARTRFIAYRQAPEGYWRTTEHRPPLLGSIVASTAVTLRAIQAYLEPYQPDETRHRIAKAKDWLLRVEPADTEDAAFQLLGLHWAGAGSDELGPMAERLSRQQRSDGGWAQLPSSGSDAYATGQALVALSDAGGVLPSSAAWRRGMEYLLRSQQTDGSWEVQTRMHKPVPGNPPYFESGFPYGHNQMISCAGTAWATMALLRAIPKVKVPDTSAFVSDIESPPAPAWMDTVLFGNAAALERLLDSGWDANSRTAEGTTALMAASPDIAKVKLLLAHGADIHTRAKSGYSALMVAANYGGTTDVVRLLLSRGARAVSEDGVKPILNASALLLAASTGEREKVSALLTHDHNLNQWMLAGGFARSTPFALALYNGDAEMIRLLVNAGANANEEQQADLSPLSIAVLMGHLELVRTLIDLGGDVNHRDKFGMTPLLWSSLLDYGSSTIPEVLLRAGARRDARTSAGLTALELARGHGYRHIERILKDEKR